MVDITNQPASALLFDPVDADINHGGTSFDHVCCDQPGTSDCGDQNVGLPGEGCEIGGAAVAKANGGISTGASASQEQGQGLADNIAATNDHGMPSAGLDPGIDQHPLDTGGRAGNEPRPPLRQEAGILGVKSIDVLIWWHGIENGDGVDMGRQGQLHQDAIGGAPFVPANG
jgi:hypothetical protein